MTSGSKGLMDLGFQRILSIKGFSYLRLQRVKWPQVLKGLVTSGVKGLSDIRC